MARGQSVTVYTNLLLESDLPNLLRGPTWRRQERPSPKMLTTKEDFDSTAPLEVVELKNVLIGEMASYVDADELEALESSFAKHTPAEADFSGILSKLASRRLDAEVLPAEIIWPTAPPCSWNESVHQLLTDSIARLKAEEDLEDLKRKAEDLKDYITNAASPVPYWIAASVKYSVDLNEASLIACAKVANATSNSRDAYLDALHRERRRFLDQLSQLSP